MQRTTPGSKVLLHCMWLRFAVWISYLSDLDFLLLVSGHGSGKAVVAGDAKTIEGSVMPPFHLSRVHSLTKAYYVKELRSWISCAPHSSVPVTVSFGLDRVPVC